MIIKFIDRHSGEIKEEKPPAEGLLNFLYNNQLGKITLLPLAKRKFISTIYGKRMDKPSSKSKIKGFVEELNIDLSESVKTITEFSSFNDFFYRKLKKEARPIGKGFISVGDGRLLAFQNISEVNQFYVKGSEFKLSRFLNDDQLLHKYEHASMVILRLAPNDYHRFHFPYDGTAGESTLIRGDYYSVSPYALVKNFAKVFCENKRTFCELKTESKGDILIVPVGATMVGSIVNTYRAKSKIAKGDEMGYFAFGGSTIVLLFNKDKFKINDDLLKNTSNGLETFVKMGEQIAV